MKNDSDDKGIDGIFATARKAQPYDPKIEYGFETRVMARIKEHRAAQTTFSSWAWRLIPAMAALVLMLGVWIYATENNQLVGMGSLAGNNHEETMLLAYLSGE